MIHKNGRVVRVHEKRLVVDKRIYKYTQYAQYNKLSVVLLGRMFVNHQMCYRVLFNILIRFFNMHIPSYPQIPSSFLF